MDYTRQFTAKQTMDTSMLRSYERAAGERTPVEIAREQSKPVSLPTVSADSPGKVGSNWQEPASLAVPGVAYVDRIADHFAALDKRDLKQRLGVKDERA